LFSAHARLNEVSEEETCGHPRAFSRVLANTYGGNGMQEERWEKRHAVSPIKKRHSKKQVDVSAV
jgi:hypothetical protein